MQEIRSTSFPDQPGVYVVFEHRDDTQPLYVGVAARQSLRARWTGNHLSGRSGSSALRRSLGCYLGLVEEKLRRPARYYEPAVEEEITRFLERCLIDLHATTSADEARALEARLIERLQPRLNIARARSSPPARGEQVIRRATPADAAAIADIWSEAARYYLGILPDDFVAPAPDGLAESFGDFLESEPSDTLAVVAEVDGQIVGFLGARLLSPGADARCQMQPELREIRPRDRLRRRRGERSATRRRVVSRFPCGDMGPLPRCHRRALRHTSPQS